MEVPKSMKKRRLTDKSLPNVILHNPEFAEDSEMYQSLLEMERKLDWTITRKKAEIQDTLVRPPITTRTLRVFLSHTVSGQFWQTGGEGSDKVNFENGDGIAAWTLKIDGRLLQQPTEKGRDKVPTKKFSQFIKKMVIDMDRDPTTHSDNIVEWPRSSYQAPAQDGFTLKRVGDTVTNIRIVLHLDHYPEQFKVHPDLASIIGIKQESRTGVIQALWSYIKIQSLQDKVDRRTIHADEKLRNIFGVESLPFQKIPEAVNRFLLPPDPVLLYYTIDPSVAPPERPTAWDIDLRMEDSAMKTRVQTLLHASKEVALELHKLDEEIALQAQSLHNSQLKRTFLQSFADDPAKFIQQWLDSQSRDLDTILGNGPSEGLTIRQEELRRSEFFKLPWVEEAVAVQEGIRLAAKGGA